MTFYSVIMTILVIMTGFARPEGVIITEHVCSKYRTPNLVFKLTRLGFKRSVTSVVNFVFTCCLRLV